MSQPEFVRHNWARRPERDFKGYRQYQCEGECKQWVAYPNDDTREPDGCCWLAEVGDTVTPGDYPGRVIAVDFDRREVMVGFGSTLADQRESAIPLSFDDVARLLKEDAGVLPSLAKAVRERQAP